MRVLVRFSRFHETRGSIPLGSTKFFNGLCGAAKARGGASVPYRKFLFTLSLDGEGPAAEALD
jgi:hypothetical protein